MRDALLEHLHCIHCGGRLALQGERREAAHVVSGTLGCPACGSAWPIVNGVPDFVAEGGRADVEQTTSGFAQNWRRYSDVILAQPALNDELFRDWIAPVQPERFEKKIVVDAGCGMGRWLAAAAPHAPSTLIGFDYSEIAHAAYANTRHLKNVHVVRADIFALPFAKRSVDVCYSIGVVHHTHDPEAAWSCLVDLVRDDGILAVWVYGKENNAWIEGTITPLRTLLTSRLPDPALHAVTKLLTAQLSLAARAYARVFPVATSFSYDAYARHLLKYPRAYLEHIVYDHLVPQLAHYLPRADLERWASSRDLAYLLTSRNANSWRLITARSPDALRRYTEGLGSGVVDG